MTWWSCLTRSKTSTEAHFDSSRSGSSTVSNTIGLPKAIVTFGKINPLVIPPVWHWPMASAILVLGGAAMGLLGSILGLAGPRYRRPLVTGLSVTFGFAVLQRVARQA